ncbi:MAG: uridylate kinase [Gemmatimonadetes bacterium]|nr:uridylate kinase [Gemmatimonadota bacterium]
MSPAAPPDAVLKLGGSLAGCARLDALLETLGELARDGRRLVVVPGGGPFADVVRRECRFRDPGASAAHWMAILAMDQLARLLVGRLAARGGPAALAHSRAGIHHALARRRLAVLAPFRWLRAADPLPHSWDVTGDSIAAWVAARLGAPRLVLLKSVDGVVGADGRVLPVVERAALGGVVDGYFCRALEAGMECWIVNGRHPARVRALLEGAPAPATRIG